jgi:hypothetical protein
MTTEFNTFYIKAKFENIGVIYDESREKINKS